MPVSIWSWIAYLVPFVVQQHHVATCMGDGDGCIG